MGIEPLNDILVSTEKLDRDIIAAIKSERMKLSRSDIRYLVDAYYQMQEYRKAAVNQVRTQPEEPNRLVEWLSAQQITLEKQILRALDAWTETDHVSRWAKSQFGVGPVISAGLAAHIDIEKAPTVGHIWNFAGLNPDIKWEKGKKRPWNARLKVLCWKIGESFKKFHNHDDCFYGKLYEKRKAYEIERNESGGNAECAAATLGEKKIKDESTRACYESGKLPPGRLDLRATRWATKIFLSHWHGEAYRNHYGTEPPKPFAIAILNHAHMIEPQHRTVTKIVSEPGSETVTSDGSEPRIETVTRDGSEPRSWKVSSS